ncbi:MAG: hypothetical protein JJT96_15115 [Opitutales bacterium]|nr:hypothetical protein [Opitutales bacterium]
MRIIWRRFWRNDGNSAEGIRRRLKAQMGDVSVFMREVKTRSTLWYNGKCGRVGTFWAELTSRQLRPW